MTKIAFTVPLTPPSVNNYVRHYRNGRNVVRGEAVAFKDAIAVFSRQEYVQGKKFYVSITVVLAKKQKGDVDNFPKLVLDGLARAGVFRDRKGNWLSDAYVRHLHVFVDEDERPDEGRTEIVVEAMG